MYYVYILRSKKDKDLYIGCTKDLRKRFKEHNDGLSDSTSQRRPFELIYYEAILNKEDAFDREKYLKTGWGRNYLRKTLKRFLALKNLGG